jgi:Resolvase, N terminal domain
VFRRSIIEAAKCRKACRLQRWISPSSLGNVPSPGIEFVSFSEQLDTSTPARKMVFTVLGAVAELERGLIVERVKAGLRNARSKGKRLGRPKKILDAKRVATLRAKGIGWKRIAAEPGSWGGIPLSRRSGGFLNSRTGFLNRTVASASVA